MFDAMYRDFATSPVILPAYGKSVCSMSNSDGITFYLYIPISVLLLFNIGFFLATIMTMMQYKKGIRDAFNGISNNTSTKVDQSFGIYARLFIIMGIFWITQIVCWFALPQSDNSKTFLSLCISGGCCTTPPDISRKISMPSHAMSLTRKGTRHTSQDMSTETAKHRISTESNKTIVLNVRNPVPSITSEDSRKISVTSNETVISHVESGFKVPGVMDDNKLNGLSRTVSSEPAAETSF
ncbi:putative G-protein coupled receptor Mth-like 4 [Orchesella cincta]|uniref:Putative G-protein coupled receptor Mth-like 4 n=1 Tax=Orchesella cincta TaxID=48709 RepID=A0A1D2M4S1_ORCCI|nr:putative G-protein coupled receptor Mth-like 4 [Orchesella cincta]